MSISYPNGEHEKADRQARATAIAVLLEIEKSAMLIRNHLAKGHSCDPSDAQPLIASARRLTEKLTVLSTLRDVREWHAADMAEQS